MGSRIRIESPTGIYHIMHRGNNKAPIFQEEHEKRRMYRFLKEGMKDLSIEIYAYCIMSNHLHLLLKADLKELAVYVHRFARNFAEYYNWNHQHVGHVFQGRFRSECIDSEEYFWACLRYIHLNPVKGGLVRNMVSYHYSSAREYRQEQPELVHKKAFQLKQRRFPEVRGFWDMHGKFGIKVFADMEEDLYPYYEEIMENYAAGIKEKYALQDIKLVYNTPKFRGELKKQMRETLNLSVHKVNFIFDRVTIQF